MLIMKIARGEVFIDGEDKVNNGNMYMNILRL